jgi:hypothetical protein
MQTEQTEPNVGGDAVPEEEGTQNYRLLSASDQLRHEIRHIIAQWQLVTNELRDTIDPNQRAILTQRRWDLFSNWQAAVDAQPEALARDCEEAMAKLNEIVRVKEENMKQEERQKKERREKDKVERQRHEDERKRRDDHKRQQDENERREMERKLEELEREQKEQEEKKQKEERMRLETKYQKEREATNKRLEMERQKERDKKREREESLKEWEAEQQKSIEEQARQRQERRQESDRQREKSERQRKEHERKRTEQRESQRVWQSERRERNALLEMQQRQRQHQRTMGEAEATQAAWQGNNSPFLSEDLSKLATQMNLLRPGNRQSEQQEQTKPLKVQSVPQEPGQNDNWPLVYCNVRLPPKTGSAKPWLNLAKSLTNKLIGHCKSPSKTGPAALPMKFFEEPTPPETGYRDTLTQFEQPTPPSIGAIFGNPLSVSIIEPPLDLIGMSRESDLPPGSLVQLHRHATRDLESCEQTKVSYTSYKGNC